MTKYHTPYLRFIPAAVGALLVPGTAHAGMPSFTLTDVTQARFENISFFLVVLLFAAGLILLIWNRLARDFTFLPRLSYGKAVGLVVLWGLLFVLVLTMISGARELMTPGAWEKVGVTFRLTEPQKPAPAEPTPDGPRREALYRLQAALWAYARDHDGLLPPERSALPDDLWQVPGVAGVRYLFVGGGKVSEGKAPLAWEPEVFGATRFVLFRDGTVGTRTSDEIDVALAGGHP